MGVDYVYYDEQLYSVLCAKCVGSALGTVQLMAEETGVRGMQSWWKLSREVAGKTGARLEGLADRVAYPKALSSWHTAETELNRWEQDRREMEKLEGQGLSELNKKTILKRILGTLG